jgi:hypothetical protein
MDDDELMAELAEAGEERTLEQQVVELAATVADLSKRVAAKEREPKFKVWNWHQATVEQRDEWIGELRTWLNEYLFKQFPWTNHPFKVPPCWANHPESVFALAALYQTWQKAYVRQDDPDMAGWWLTKWLDLLIGRARRPASLCSPGVCKRVERPIRDLAPPEPEPEPDPYLGAQP